MCFLFTAPLSLSLSHRLYRFLHFLTRYPINLWNVERAWCPWPWQIDWLLGSVRYVFLQKEGKPRKVMENPGLQCKVTVLTWPWCKQGTISAVRPTMAAACSMFSGEHTYMATWPGPFKTPLLRWQEMPSPCKIKTQLHIIKVYQRSLVGWIVASVQNL